MVREGRGLVKAVSRVDTKQAKVNTEIVLRAFDKERKAPEKQPAKKKVMDDDADDDN